MDEALQRTHGSTIANLASRSTVTGSQERQPAHGLADIQIL